MHIRIRSLMSAALLAACSLTSIFSPDTTHAQSQRCFPETGFCIEGRFRDYWEQNGGLTVFGYPIGAAANQPNADTSGTYLTQSFERNRFELHPDQSAPYDVLLGRLGDDLLKQHGVVWQNQPRETRQDGCVWFEQTGHNVCDQGASLGFKTYWQTHGLADAKLDAYGRSLALFGLPLTKASMEQSPTDGQMYMTQWFERARMEWHPDKPDQYKVLLGLLGSEGRGTTPTPAPGTVQGHIAFFSDRNGNTDIYLTDASKGANAAPMRLTTDAALDFSPSISADGKTIVFVSERDNNLNIYAMNADGSNQRRLTSDKNADLMPQISPDGKKVVFVSERDGNQEIYVMNVDGTGQKRLTNDASRDRDPAWSPDSKRIVWASYRGFDAEHGAANNLYTMNADGTGVSRMTNSLARKLFPTWSPDGKHIAFQLFDNGGIVDGDLGGGGIALINPDGSGLKALDISVPGSSMPTWSPDGKHIAFSALRVDTYTLDLFMVNADGTNLQPLVTDSANDSAPSWGR